uniref:CMP/dCMP-type deaminase domain-containing protein n=1 Tax=viral metagenome TaxID=1070528 RepID=A0A6C0AC52_9ZZZZ
MENNIRYHDTSILSDEILKAMKDKLVGRKEGYNHVAVYVPIGDLLTATHVRACAGINTERTPYNGVPYDTHAEKDALDKIIRNSNYRQKSNTKGIKLDLYVMSFSPTGLLRMSKPCCLCIKMLNNISKRGIIVKNIYYSNSNRGITRVRLSDISNITRKKRKN